MNKRTLSSVVLAIVIISILVINIPLLDTIFIFVLSVMGIYEYNKAFKNAGYHPIEWVGYIASLTIFFMGGYIDIQTKIVLARILIPILLILMFIYIFLKDLKVSVIDLAITLLSVVYIPFMFSFLKLILSMNMGRLLVMYAFFGAFSSDIFAYLIGCKFGKRKLCPTISPKKTVEGSIAGIIGVVITYIIITFIGNNYCGANLNYIYISILAVVASITGQFGDLAASAIKRHCNIKDFGNILPGHGGILDRYDSVMFVAPVVYIFLKVYMGM